MHSVLLFLLSFFWLTEAGSNLKLDGRIVGGVYSRIKDFPYQLSMRIYGFHFCGASIISEYWALSAAHCVDNMTARDIELYGGTSNRLTSGYRHRVSRIISHEKYNSITLDFDLALLVVFDPFITWNRLYDERKVSLPSRYDVPRVGSLATTSGWGSIADGYSWLSDQLLSVKIPIVSRWECQIDYPNEVITIRMLCAGYRGGGKDACQGDSGGPLVLNGKLIGVVSWGNGCGIPYSPGVYTNVAALRDWIRKHTRI